MPLDPHFKFTTQSDVKPLTPPPNQFHAESDEPNLAPSELAPHLPTGTLTVAGIASYIKDSLELDPNLDHIWVLGEVSESRSSAKGLHFTLRDAEGKQTIGGVVWHSAYSKLATQPQVGEQVVVLGRVRVYPQQSKYQLQVTQILPAGEGLQALQFRQLKQRLEAEGLFDPRLRQPLPLHPQVIAVVTSPNAAAWGDIQRTLNNRYPGLHVLLSIATVQGKDAPASIEAAIRRVEADNRAEVMIVARGGGSVEDLACFNDERVVRAVALCRVPVITGIGHDRDESLADYAADFHAATPTAAAMQVVPDLQDLLAQHFDRIQALQTIATATLEREQRRLVSLHQRLARITPDRQLALERRRIADLKRQLVSVLRFQRQTAAQKHLRLHDKLVTLDPRAVLQRGYALVRSENRVLRSSQDLAIGDSIEVQWAQGSIQATVTQVRSEQH